MITDLDIGGAELMLARLLAHCSRDRISHAVICLTSGGPVAEQIRRANIPLYTLDMRRGGVDPAFLWKLSKCLQRLKPDILQSWLYHADLAGLIAGRFAHVPHVVWNIRCAELRADDHSASLRVIMRTLAWLSHLPAIVVTNSIAGKRAHEKLGYRPDRWVVIPNGIDTTIFRPAFEARSRFRGELRVGDDTRLVGVLARLHPMKDHATFLRAAAVIAQTRADTHFVLAGRDIPNDPSLNLLARDLGLVSRVHFLGERSDPSHVLAALDVAVSSSYSEAFPNVVAEAMACGTPCAVTDAGDSAAIVGGAGVVVPCRDVTALARGVAGLLDLDVDSRNALAAAARHRIVSEYSIQRAVSTYEALYTDLAGRTVDGHLSCAE